MVTRSDFIIREETFYSFYEMRRDKSSVKHTHTQSKFTISSKLPNLKKFDKKKISNLRAISARKMTDPARAVFD